VKQTLIVAAKDVSNSREREREKERERIAVNTFNDNFFLKWLDFSNRCTSNI